MTKPQLFRSILRPRAAQSRACRQPGRESVKATVIRSPNSATRPLTSRRVVARSDAPQHSLQDSTQKAHISTATMTERLKAIISPEFLASIRDFWFDHVKNEDDLILPDQTVFMPWFAGGEFDTRCVEKFHPCLDAIKATGITNADDLLKIVEPQSPFDWLSLVLLLDQMPRNCYRGDSSKIVFNYFDPISLGVAQAAAAKNITAAPGIRWFTCRGIWFNLPFTHSESHAMHEKAMTGCERLEADMLELLEKPEVNGQDEIRAHAAQVYKGNDEKVRYFANMTSKAEVEHYDIIKKFGRYPHRNKPLGRESTAEETEFLANGGATFAPPPPEKKD